MTTPFRNLPGMHRFLSDERIRQLESVYSRELVLETARRRYEEAREEIARGGPPPSFEELVDAVTCRLVELTGASLRPVINATGVILHTNLGRAPMSHEALEAARTASAGYVNLELDLATGKRGTRQIHIESLLCRVTGAQAALVVNNNAAAVLLALAALARGKEVIVSRGQAVEIGGGFRIPEIMRQGGARLIEVGTTNRTYAADYEQAVTPKTTAFLRVHSSNFRVVGFVQAVSLEELTELGQRLDVPVLDDIGSGCLLDTARFGLEAEPMVQESVAAGAALVMFSGDKLLGGPQAGIVVGRRELVAKLARHPLARAMRIDKERLAGLAATLVHYLKGEALVKVPIWRMIATPVETLERRAAEWRCALGSAAAVVEERSTVGGGSLPGGTLLTRVIAIEAGKTRSVQELAEALRLQDPPVMARVERNRLLLDIRTILPEEDGAAIGAVRKAMGL